MPRAQRRSGVCTKNRHTDIADNDGEFRCISVAKTTPWEKRWEKRPQGDVGKLIRTPLWDADTVFEESLLMVKDEAGCACAPLLFEPTEILRDTGS